MTLQKFLLFFQIETAIECTTFDSALTVEINLRGTLVKRGLENGQKEVVRTLLLYGEKEAVPIYEVVRSDMEAIRSFIDHVETIEDFYALDYFSSQSAMASRHFFEDFIKYDNLHEQFALGLSNSNSHIKKTHHTQLERIHRKCGYNQRRNF